MAKLYEILGLGTDATDEQIEQAFKAKLANEKSEEIKKELELAYSILGDKSYKFNYDHGIIDDNGKSTLDCETIDNENTNIYLISNYENNASSRSRSDSGSSSENDSGSSSENDSSSSSENDSSSSSENDSSSSSENDSSSSSENDSSSSSENDLKPNIDFDNDSNQAKTNQNVIFYNSQFPFDTSPREHDILENSEEISPSFFLKMCSENQNLILGLVIAAAIILLIASCATLGLGLCGFAAAGTLAATIASTLFITSQTAAIVATSVGAGVAVGAASGLIGLSIFSAKKNTRSDTEESDDMSSDFYIPEDEEKALIK